MGMRDLPDMYAQSPRVTGPRAYISQGHTYQTNHKNTCYKQYVTLLIVGFAKLNDYIYSVACVV